MFYSKRMSKYMQMKSKIKFTTRFIYCCSFQFQVLCRNLLNATNSKDRPTVDAKIQLNVELTFYSSIELQ